MIQKLKLLAFFILISFSQNILADYPIISHRYLADPGAMVYNGRVYLYCSNDDENADDGEGGYLMQSIVCVSSSDMKNWTDHGVVFRVPRDASWANRSWAPSVVELNGKFYLYFGDGGSGIGVASADNPLGPFKDPLDDLLIKTSTPGVLPADNMWLFDPMTFIDDDGQAYIYFGGNGDDNVRVARLNEDMISLDGPAQQITALDFFEASWMHKHNGTYYFTYSTNPSAGMRIDYLTSVNPMSGFSYGGIVSQQPPRNNNNNHQAIFNYKGNWYQAYHNRYVSNEAGIEPTYKRNLCVDQFSHNEDGSIEMMENTVDGLEQLDYVDPYQRVEAETMDAQNGIYTEKCSEGGMNVNNIENGDWIKVRGVDFGASGPAAFSASIASEAGTGILKGGTFEIRIDQSDGRLIGTVPVSYTGGLDDWKLETIATDSVTGVHDIYFSFKGVDAENLFHFDYWMFTEKTDTQDLLALNATIDEYKIDTIAGHNSTNINVTAIYADGTSQDITSESTFTFNPENRVSIADGIVRGLGYGEVIVSTSYNEKNDSVKIIVVNKESELSVQQVYANTNSVELFTGESLPIEISAQFNDGHVEIVTNKATYDNPSPDIATIINGAIEAISAGEVDITASYKGELGETRSTIINVIVSNRSPYNQNEAEEFSAQSGIETENCSDIGGGLNIAYIEDGDWVRFNSLDFENGATSFDVRVASETNGGNIELCLDNPDGVLVGTCTVNETGGWQSWETASCDVDIASGTHDLYLVFSGGGGFLMNINWWQFSNDLVTVDPNQHESFQISVITNNNIKYLKGLIPGDVITIYNSSGQTIQTFHAKSNLKKLNSLQGFIIIKVRRNQHLHVIKSIL